MFLGLDVLEAKLVAAQKELEEKEQYEQFVRSRASAIELAGIYEQMKLRLILHLLHLIMNNDTISRHKGKERGDQQVAVVDRQLKWYCI